MKPDNHVSSIGSQMPELITDTSIDVSSLLGCKRWGLGDLRSQTTEPLPGSRMIRATLELSVYPLFWSSTKWVFWVLVDTRLKSLANRLIEARSEIGVLFRWNCSAYQTDRTPSSDRRDTRMTWAIQQSCYSLLMLAWGECLKSRLIICLHYRTSKILPRVEMRRGISKAQGDLWCDLQPQKSDNKERTTCVQHRCNAEATKSTHTHSGNADNKL